MNPTQQVEGILEQHDSFTTLDLGILLLERKELILKSAFGFGALVALIVLLLPTQYKATTTFLPPAQGQSSSSALLSQLGNMGPLAAMGQGSLGLKNPLDLQVSLLKSESIRQAMVERFGLMSEFHTQRMSDALKKLDHKTEIEADSKDGLIHLSITDEAPQRAAQLANGYLDEYRKLTSRLVLDEAAQRRLFFEQQLRDAKDKLAESEESLKKTEQDSGLVQADSQARVLFQNAASLQAQITEKQVQVEAMRTYAGSGNADLLQAEKELSGLRSALAKLGVGKTAPDSFDLTKGQLPQANLEYIRKVRDVKYQETLFEILARQYESARLDEAKEGAPVQVVDRAQSPDHRAPRFLALLTFLGMFAGAAAASSWIAIQSGLQGDLKHKERMVRFRRALAFRRHEAL